MTIEREIGEVIRGSYARTAEPPAKRRIGALELLSEVLDAASFVSWDTDLVSIPAGPEYLDQLAEARSSSGLDEAVITGEGTDTRTTRLCHRLRVRLPRRHAGRGRSRAAHAGSRAGY